MANSKVKYEIVADSSGATKAIATVDDALAGTADTASATAAEIESSLNRAEQAADDLGSTAKGTDKDLGRVEDGLKALADEADQAGGELKKVNTQLDLTADGAGDLGDKSGKLSGILGLLSPELGDIAQGLGDFTDAGEVLLGSLGGLSISVEAVAAGITGLGVVLLAGVALYSQYEGAIVDSETEAARLNVAIIEQGRVAKKSADEVEALNTAWDSFLQLGSDLQEQFDLINGKLTEQEAETRKAKDTAIEAARANLLAQGQEIASRKQRIAAIDAAIEAGERDSKQMAEDYAERNRLVAEIDRETAAMAAMKAELTDTLDKTELSIEYKYETAKADKAKQEAAEQAAEAERIAAEQAANLAAEQAAQIAALDAATAKTVAYQNALMGMAGVVDNVTATMLTPLEKLQAEQDKAQAALLAQYTDAALAAVGSQEDQLAAYQAFREGQAAIDAVYQTKKDEQAAKDKADADKAKQEADKARADELLAAEQAETKKRDLYRDFAVDTLELLQAFSEQEINRRSGLIEKLQAQLDDASGNLTAAEKEHLEQRIKNQRKAQIALFRVNQIATAGQVAITGFHAATLAYKDGLEAGGPAGLVLGPAMAATAAGFTAVQLARVLAQKPAFHAGGFGDSPTGSLAPDEYLTRKTRNEATLNPVGRASLGDDTIRKANQGRLGTEQNQIVIVYKHNHRVLDIALQENFRNGGELAKVGNTRYKVGHRKQ